jgi:hypothetical protein
MGYFKELYAAQVNEIERAMDIITQEYDEILSVGNYIDNLLDYFEKEVIEDFYVNIVEYQDELLWRAENGN